MTWEHLLTTPDDLESRDAESMAQVADDYRASAEELREQAIVLRRTGRDSAAWGCEKARWVLITTAAQIERSLRGVPRLEEGAA